jgi:competence protein ComEA
MKNLFRDFLSFSALERKGVFLLIIIIVVITGINIFLVNHPPSVEIETNALLLKELRSFEQQLTIQNDSSGYLPPVFHESVARPGELFLFDPNSASSGDLRRLGLNNRLIRTMLNYRLHGGKFYQKEDLNKVYGMSSGLYERLAPYVYIRESPKLHTELKLSKPIIHNVPVNINMADSATLEKLRGIGPILAKRVLRYRSLLGGYYDTGQLKEVYGITDSLFSVIKPELFADTTTIIKLNINHATENELAHHPYIGKYTARGIVRYRSIVHTINCLDELKTNGLVPSENLERLKKYLTI